MSDVRLPYRKYLTLLYKGPPGNRYTSLFDVVAVVSQVWNG